MCNFYEAFSDWEKNHLVKLRRLIVCFSLSVADLTFEQIYEMCAYLLSGDVFGAPLVDLMDTAHRGRLLTLLLPGHFIMQQFFLFFLNLN